MSRPAKGLQQATIAQHCKALRMPAVASQFVGLADEAVRERQTHLDYLEALLEAEVEEAVRKAVEFALNSPFPSPEELHEFVY